MQIDLRTVGIQPVRKTFDHLSKRFGDKPASRYQEGSYDIQVVENMHYRPTWDPEQELYDASISKIVMEDWYAIKDPRQFYYSSYTIARSRQQETTEANFNFVETRGLADALGDDLRAEALKTLVPLRHAAWGANQNNSFICGYGYATTFTQPCIYHAMDNLGIAQYLSRLGLLLGGTEALEAGKDDWMNNERWQPLRRYVEDSMVVRDPMELFVAQNLVLDGLLYSIIYDQIVDTVLSGKGGSTIAMLCQFMNDWSVETRKWIDSVIKVVVKESDANKAVIDEWVAKWTQRAAPAMVPIVEIVMKSEADSLVEEQVEQFKTRLSKIGVTL